MALCTCEDQFGNTGLSGCEQIQGVAKTVILQAKYKADGTRNTIDVTSATLGADILALTNAVTPAIERLYPLPVAENVTREMSEDVYETSPSNRRYFVQDGIRTNVFQFLGKNSAFAFLGELQKFGCSDLQFYVVDNLGVLWGSSVVNGELQGVAIADSTYQTMLMNATDTTVQKIQLEFDTEQGFDDSTWAGITPNELGYRADELQGLIELSLTDAVITATSIVGKIGYKTSSAVNPIKSLVGLVAGDMTLTELSPTTGSVAIATATYDAVTQLYTITFASQTADDVLNLKATKSRFFLDVNVVIPA